MMKKLVILFVFLIPFNVQSKLVLSGYFFDEPLYYQDTSITSYGKVVSGQIHHKRKNDSNQIVNRVANFLYFCKFDELTIVNNELTYFDSEGNFVSRNSSDSSQNTMPMNLTSSESMDTFMGYLGFRNKLKSNCSKVSKSLPRYEIPIVRTELSVFHVLLDNLKNQGNLKKVWIKNRGIVGETMKDKDGKPLILDNLEYKDYKFNDDGKYKMDEYSVDCKKQNLQITKTISYESNGNVTESFTFPYDSKMENSLVPNSVGESIYKFVCSF